MEAQLLRCLSVALSVVAFTCSTEAATHQTVNFTVNARNPEIAEQVGKAAEGYRRQLAIFWLGKPLPNWSRPCRITVNEGALGAGGQTIFQFVRGEVLNWRMDVQGSMERILDSVLPHEINHTIFACHFRRPLPRWADEGAATLFEHRSEQLKQLSLLNEVIRSKREFISLRDLLAMKEYPRGQRPMLTLYAQGYALADFLVQQKGRHAYLKFISDGERGSWEDAIRTNFDHDGIESLERDWRGWVLAGMPKLTLPRDQMLAANSDAPELVSQETARPEISSNPTTRSLLSSPRRLPDNATVRLQSPDPKTEPNFALQEVSTDTAAGSSNRAPIRDLSHPSLPDGRHASFSAPAPRPPNRNPGEANVEVPPDKNSAPEPGTGDVLKGFPEGKANDSGTNRANRTGAANDVRDFGEFVPRPDLKQTGFTGTSVKTRTEFETTGKPMESNGSLLSRERNGNSGSAPQWAGFPGQKKLF